MIQYAVLFEALIIISHDKKMKCETLIANTNDLKLFSYYILFIRESLITKPKTVMLYYYVFNVHA